MNITRVDLIEADIPLLHHFETSYGRMSSIRRLILKVYTPDAVVFSECAVDAEPGYTYETTATAKIVLARYFLPRIMGAELSGPDDFWRRIGPLTGHRMTKAALENAVWMLAALRDGVSVAEATGGEKSRILSGGVSVGIQDSVEEFLDVVRERIGRGARRIKLKIKPGWDLKPLEAFRSHWPDMDLSVDANNGYDYKEHHDLLLNLDRFNMIMIEQPLSQEDLYYHARLQSEIQTPLCLDESIHSPFMAQAAAEMHACRIINIKQTRVGGLTPARRIHDIAERAGIGCWCGGMIETGIGMTINAAISSWPNMVYPNAVYANRGFLVEDIIEPETIVYPDGTVDVPSEPGLGVAVNEAVLDKYTRTRDIFRGSS